MKRFTFLTIVYIALILLSGCASQSSTVPMDYRWANVEGSQIKDTQAGEQFYFNILVDQGMIEAGVPVKIKSPGSRVIIEDAYAIIWRTLNTISRVEAI